MLISPHVGGNSSAFLPRAYRLVAAQLHRSSRGTARERDDPARRPRREGAVGGAAGVRCTHAVRDSRPLGIEDVELAPPGQGEVLVAIKAAGLCHSDLSVINGDRPRPMPMALGHEAAGEVHRGRPRRGRPGASATTWCWSSCRAAAIACPAAKAGRRCASPARSRNGGTLLSGERRLPTPTAPINHHLGCSAFADHAVSRAARSSRSRDLPLDEAALFGCAVLTGVGAVVNTAQVRPASRRRVGLGGVGLTALLGALASGARDVVAVDCRPTSSSSRARSVPPTPLAGPDAADEIRDPRAAASTPPSRWPARCAPSRPPTAYAPRRHDGHRRPAATRPHVSVPPTHLVAEERTVRDPTSALRCRGATSRATSPSTAGASCRWTGCSARLALDDINEGSTASPRATHFVRW